MVRPHATRLTHHGIVLCMLWGLATSSSSATGHASPQPSADALQANPTARSTQSLFDFDIPAQPLSDALDRYAALSQRPALFSSEMVAGRMSSAVHGRYPPATALHLLLEGSGIVAERIVTGPAEAFVLKATREPTPSIQSALASAGDYPGLVQARLWHALCSDAQTMPGNYRALLRFRVDIAGHIQQVRLLDSTGNPHRDAAVLNTFQRVSMDQPPPPGMSQPLIMIVLPRSADNVDASLRCDTGGSGRASS